MSQTTPHNILHWIDENFEKPVIVICLLVALILIPYQVFTRYILGTWLQFNVDTSMVEELSLFCFITAIYFGASLSIRRRKSLRMTAIMELVPERWKNLVLMVQRLRLSGADRPHRLSVHGHDGSPDPPAAGHADVENALSRALYRAVRRLSADEHPSCAGSVQADTRVRFRAAPRRCRGNGRSWPRP